MVAYYNEIDEDAAAILRQLIADDVIAPGDVDTRSIKDVRPDDLHGYAQCHFIAGGGLWSVAARLAGWPDDRPLWTGSCPCQPFSTAGKMRGTDDPRHLWPDFHGLIRAVRPPVVVGEQVAGSAGYGWFDGVSADLAGEGYASRAVDIPACAVDAPHQRNRLYWIALGQSDHQAMRPVAGELDGASRANEGASPREGRHGNAARHADDAISMAEPNGFGRERRQGAAARSILDRSDAGWEQGDRAAARLDQGLRNGSFWADAEWIECFDGKSRRAQPGLPLLADGVPGRVGVWRVAGNAISPVLAAEVLAALNETLAA